MWATDALPFACGLFLGKIPAADKQGACFVARQYTRESLRPHVKRGFINMQRASRGGKGQTQIPNIIRREKGEGVFIFCRAENLPGSFLGSVQQQSGSCFKTPARSRIHSHTRPPYMQHSPNAIPFPPPLPGMHTRRPLPDPRISCQFTFYVRHGTRSCTYAQQSELVLARWTTAIHSQFYNE